MDIKSAQYYANDGENCSVTLTLSDGKVISAPLDPDNRHYAAILEWVAEGNTIEEAD
tara:strand:+ start:1861 stop:2031 length:171 start_codon:yes stop_codon:yes gene_type:complete